MTGARVGETRERERDQGSRLLRGLLLQLKSTVGYKLGTLTPPKRSCGLADLLLSTVFLILPRCQKMMAPNTTNA